MTNLPLFALKYDFGSLTIDIKNIQYVDSQRAYYGVSATGAVLNTTADAIAMQTNALVASRYGGTAKSIAALGKFSSALAKSSDIISVGVDLGGGGEQHQSHSGCTHAKAARWLQYRRANHLHQNRRQQRHCGGGELRL